MIKKTDIHIHRPRHYSGGPQNFMTTHEILLFFKEIKNPRDIAIFTLMYLYGLRATELCELKRSDIDIKKNLIYIKALKKGVTGKYYLNELAIKKIKPYLKIREILDVDLEHLFISKIKKPMTRQQIAQLTLKYGLLAELDRSKLFSHIFRHSITIHMASSSTDIATVQLHLRHKSMASTLHYFGVINEAKLKLQAKALQGEYVAGI